MGFTAVNQSKAYARGAAMRIHRFSLVLAAAVSLVWAGSALAQVQPLQLNHPLDANPQVGSGGANAPVPGFVPINGNEIMTGNVSGLSYWHGQVGRPGGGNGLGTFSPNQFQGQLGSGSFTNFARQTAGGDITSGKGGQITQSYYLPSTTVSTAQGSFYSSPTGSGFDSSLVPTQAINPTVSGAQLSAIAPNNTSAFLQPGAIDRTVSAPIVAGTPGALLDNPLFGPRQAEEAAFMAQQQAAQDQREGKLPVPGTENLPVSPGQQNTPGTETPGTPTTNPSEVQGQVPELIASRNAAIKGQVGGKGVDWAVSDHFKTIADQLKEAAGGEETPEPKRGLTLAGTAGRVELDPLTGRQRQMTLTNQGGTAGAGAATRPGLLALEQPLSPKRLEDLSTNQLTAGSKVKPVKLAPETGSKGVGFIGAGDGPDSAFNTLMSRGSDSLKAGKYLDAVGQFQSALAAKPEDPLAVVGRAHAELGAGLYSSSAFDLKFVYTRRPEMVSLKYDVGSFIPGPRQDVLLADLAKLSDNKDTADMSSFLYCYLCYQTSRTPEMQAELKKWGARDGHDAWQGVLQRAWGGQIAH